MIWAMPQGACRWLHWGNCKRQLAQSQRDLCHGAMPPITAKLQLLELGVQVEIVVTNQANDLHRCDADVAIQSIRPTEPDLLAKRSVTPILALTRGRLQMHS